MKIIDSPSVGDLLRYKLVRSGAVPTVQYLLHSTAIYCHGFESLQYMKKKYFSSPAFLSDSERFVKLPRYRAEEGATRTTKKKQLLEPKFWQGCSDE